MQLKNREEEQVKFEQKLQKEVEEFIPRLKHKVEVEVTEKVEQEWIARVAVLEKEIKALQMKIAASHDQLS